MNRHHTSSAGFSTISFLLFLPVLLAVFVTIIALFYLLKDEGQSRHLCRTSALSMQEKVAERLNTLIGMNVQAKELRLEREAADRAVDNSGGIPYVLAIALANKARVIAEQTAFAADQQAIIADARRIAWFSKFELQAKLRSALQVQSALQSGDFSHSWLGAAAVQSQITINSPEFKVDASPQESLSPDYQPADDFSKSEALHVKWQLRVAQLLPHWMQAIIKNGGQDPRLSVDLGCGATIVASTDDPDSDPSTTDSNIEKPTTGKIISSVESAALDYVGGQTWVAKLNQDK